MNDLLVNFNHLLEHRSREFLLQMGDPDRRRLLRELLEMKRGADVWLSICELFASWPPGTGKSASLDAACAALESWDDHLRHLSSSWRFLYEANTLSPLALLVRSIELYQREECGSSELWKIATSEYARNLRSLMVYKSEISSGAFRSMIQSRDLADLSHLEIRKTVLFQEDVEQLFRASALGGLKTLKLVEVGLQGDTFRSSVDDTPFTGLELLDLSSNFLGTEGLQHLARMRWFSSIKHLVLQQNGIQDDAVSTLMQAPGMNTLRSLDLSHNPISTIGKKTLRDKSVEKKIQLIL